MKPCSFPDCTRPHKCHGYCLAHSRQLARGVALTPLLPRKVVKQYVDDAYANRDRTTGCWDDWPFSSQRGRPQMLDPRRLPSDPPRPQFVARYVVSLTHGEWPICACHHCDNKACWNPDHLYAGDYSTNLVDAWARVRRNRKAMA